jgi:hypothetical protein
MVTVEFDWLDSCGAYSSAIFKCLSFSFFLSLLSSLFLHITPVYRYMSYIASLNLLNTDSPAPHSEEGFSDDLALWANAQFTFDSAPGSALLEDDKKEENEKLFASLTDFSLGKKKKPHMPLSRTLLTHYAS